MFNVGFYFIFGQCVYDYCVTKSVEFALYILSKESPQKMVGLKFQKISLRHSYCLCFFVAVGTARVELVQVDKVFNA